MLINKDVTFDNLAVRFGEVLAWHYLVEIEKASGIRPRQSWGSDPETRLAHALHVQDMARTAQVAA